MTDRLKKLNAFLEASPDDPFLLFAIAKEYEKIGDQDAALNQYEILLKKSPDYVGTFYHFGKLKEATGLFNEAIDLYAKGMEVAKAQGDQHAFSELAGAKLALDDD